ncbi:hypothetical protein ABTZ58_25150 [Streptomyces sp. NPDC094143]
MREIGGRRDTDLAAHHALDRSTDLSRFAGYLVRYDAGSGPGPRD